MTETAPPHPTGHGLLAGRTVLVTAAAGTGIGFATAQRAVEEGATVVLSDAHERRLAEAAERLAESAGEEPLAVPCDVTDEAQVGALFAAAEARHGGLDVVVCNAGLGGTAEVADMTDEQWSKVLDVTLTGTFRCNRAAVRHMYPRRLRGDRQQRLGPGLAGAGRPEPLRGGQGRGDGPHPVRGHGGGAPRRPGQRRRPEPGRPPLPGQGDAPRRCWTS